MYKFNEISFKFILVIVISNLYNPASADYTERETIKCNVRGEICPIDQICEYNCQYPCFNTPMTLIPIYGTTVYLRNSSLCKAALHDLRISKWNHQIRNIKIRSFNKQDCFLEASVRFGFSSYSTQNKSCSVFEFIGPHVSEIMLDVVSLHANYLFDDGESHKQYCFSSSNALHQTIKFTAYLNWTSSTEEKQITKYGDFTQNTKIWNETKAYGFQCIPHDTTLSCVTSIAFSKDASFLPKTLTRTVNKGENITLYMNEQDTELNLETEWRKDGKLLYHQHKERTQISLINVHEGSSGIYSLGYVNSSGTIKLGFQHLIVRRCPRGKYGINCSFACSSCLNGGVCHDITGECVCAPGFNGSRCEKACQSGYIGKLCNIKCPSEGYITEHSCKGFLICLPNPYGCSCSAGFSGLHCNKICKDGFYGAGCLQQHKHYNRVLNSCSKFSDLCECLPGWHGMYCNESYPTLSNGPTVLNISENSILISFKAWSIDVDLGIGDPVAYEVIYKVYGNEHWTNWCNISQEAQNETHTVNIINLKPGTHYAVAVVVVDETGNKQEDYIHIKNVTTSCDTPTIPPYNIKLSTLNQNISVIWKIPPKETWNCWNIQIKIKIRENSTTFILQRNANETFYSFFSEPFINWVIEICILSMKDNLSEICAKPKNITSKGLLHLPHVKLKIIKHETSVSFSWKPPLTLSGKMVFYNISFKDVSSGIVSSHKLLIQNAACKRTKVFRHCYTLNNLVGDHQYNIEITLFIDDNDEGTLIKSFTVKLGNVTNSLSTILGVSIPLLFTLLLLIFILYFKKHNSLTPLQVKFLPYNVENEFAACNEALDEMDIIETESMCEDISNQIYVKDLSEYVKQNVQSNKFRKEFLSVPNGQMYPCSIAKLGENKPKNRYGNILPYDHSRVILDTINGDAFSNYIHANYIHGYEKIKKYIATQGPLYITINDFWRMIWNEGSCKILMMTGFVENGKPKCEKYWSDECSYGDILISLKDSKLYANFTIRTFKISKGKNSREVKQFHFITWPDHGAPPNSTALIAYLKKVRSYRPDYEAPIVVHCSAGIGRTGTVILLDSMIDMGLREKYVDLVNHLCYMRKQRMNILENLEQYIFVYNALVEYLCFEETCVKSTDFKTELERLQLVDNATSLTCIEKQFQALKKIRPEFMYKDTQTGYLMENQSKNRSMFILPFDQARPILSKDFSSSGYINAVYVDSFSTKNAFVATQYPLPETLEDFWNMIYDLKSKTVILLQEVDYSINDNPRLWLPEELQIIGVFQIECQAESEENNLKISNISISNKAKENDDSLLVNVITVKGWDFKSSLPIETFSIMSAISKVHLLQSESKHVITTICFDGVTACGIFCAMLYICDQIRTDEEVDICHAVKCVKTNRPQFIQNLNEYKFLYELVMLYLNPN